MSKLDTFTPQRVEYIPEELLEGVLYISERFETAVHRCCCGCREEVVTPLGAGGWTLTRDGEVVTLQPSIGNQQFACRSHYWLRANRVVWCQ